ncbi:MAG TPA: CAP domain-containing protein [Ohtaekwangia sp.]|uniref:CAP domain-containing protein n=1 Tax=Ohtaekwangia sp. TaxID=2066019 RepID=UPI002F94301A
MKTIVLVSFLFLALSAFDKRRPVADETICLSPEEMKLYDLIMEYRKSKGLESIPLSSKLTKVAQIHGRDLADNYTFDPNNKCNPHSWSKKGNWTSCCYTSDHKQAQCMWDKPKEIAGYPSQGFEIAYWSSSGATAQEGLDGWKISPGHNPLLINSGTWSKVKWKAIGVALYKEYGLVWFGEVTDAEIPSACNQ